MSEQGAELSWCQDHWDRLRREVDDQGMGHLVSKDGAEAARRMASTDPRDIEPLMAIHNNILGRVLGNCLAAGGFPDGCPLCIVQGSFEQMKNNPKFDPELHLDAEGWIIRVTSSLAQYLRDQGVLGEKRS